MQQLKIEWERVETGKNAREASSTLLRVAKNSKTAKNYAVMYLPRAVTLKLGWTDKDRVTLYKRGTALFMLKKEQLGLLNLKKSGKQLIIRNTDACMNVYPNLNGENFEAWADTQEKAIIFKPVKKEVDIQ